MSSQKIGPRLIAKEATYAMRINTASQPCWLLGAWARKTKPMTAKLTAIPLIPVNSSGLLPTRSISHMATSVIKTFTKPIPAVARIAPVADGMPAD